LDSICCKKHFKRGEIIIYKCSEIMQKLPKNASTAWATTKKNVSSERVNAQQKMTGILSL